MEETKKLEIVGFNFFWFGLVPHIRTHDLTCIVLTAHGGTRSNRCNFRVSRWRSHHRKCSSLCFNEKVGFVGAVRSNSLTINNAFVFPFFFFFFPQTVPRSTLQDTAYLIRQWTRWTFECRRRSTKMSPKTQPQQNVWNKDWRTSPPCAITYWSPSRENSLNTSKITQTLSPWRRNKPTITTIFRNDDGNDDVCM